MKHTAIKINLVISIFIFLIYSVNALEFSFDGPSSVKIKEEFVVKIYASTSEIYDIKVYVKDKNNDVLSEIYDGNWKSAFYFVKESFPSKTEYNARVTKISNSYELCVKLRKTGKTTTNEKCSSLDVDQTSSNSPSDSETNPNSESTSKSSESEIVKDSNKEKENNKKDVEKNNNLNEKGENDNDISKDLDNNTDTSPQIKNQITNNSIQQDNQDNIEEKIFLNKPNKDNLQSPYSISTKEDTFRTYLIIAFSLFAVIITILLAMRKL